VICPTCFGQVEGPLSGGATIGIFYSTGHGHLALLLKNNMLPISALYHSLLLLSLNAKTKDISFL
jgi:hypothetical protein